MSRMTDSDHKIYPNSTPFDINIILHTLKKRVELGEELLRIRPINKGVYDNWDYTTREILKTSALIDPTALERFSLCGKNGRFHKKSNDAFWENHRAMSVYDKLRILGYHINKLKCENKSILAFLENPDVNKDN